MSRKSVINQSGVLPCPLASHRSTGRHPLQRYSHDSRSRLPVTFYSSGGVCFVGLCHTLNSTAATAAIAADARSLKHMGEGGWASDARSTERNGDARRTQCEGRVELQDPRLQALEARSGRSMKEDHEYCAECWHYTKRWGQV